MQKKGEMLQANAREFNSAIVEQILPVTLKEDTNQISKLKLYTLMIMLICFGTETTVSTKL